MLNRSPWLWGVRKTAAGMTGRTSLGLQILQGRRAKGQSNPSPEYVQNQAVARYLWPIFRLFPDVVRRGFTILDPGQAGANRWFSYNRDNSFDLATPPVATFVYQDFVISQGIIAPTLPVTPAASVAGNIISVNFSSTVDAASQSLDDEVLMVVYNATLDKWAVQNTGPATRADGIATVSPVPSGFMAPTNTLYIYLGFVGGPTGPYPGKSSTSESVAVVVAA